MPTYDFQCDNEKCAEEFQVFCSMSEMDNPHECPKCGESRKQKRIYKSAPMVSMNAHRFGGTKSSAGNGFNEVLKNIHERTPGSQLDKSTKI